jgi:hypothetical protein
MYLRRLKRWLRRKRTKPKQQIPMTESEKKLLKGFLSKTLKMDEEAMSSLFNEDGELTTIEPALKLDSERRNQDEKRID